MPAAPRHRGVWWVATLTSATALAAALSLLGIELAGRGDGQVPPASAAMAVAPSTASTPGVAKTIAQRPVLREPAATDEPRAVVPGVQVARERPVDTSRPPTIDKKSAPESARAHRVDKTIARRASAQAPSSERLAVSKPVPTEQVAAAPDSERGLLRRYQRAGHDLLALQQRLGYAYTADLMMEFRAIDLTTATATARSRQQLAAELARLEAILERNRAIELSDDCRNNPLATGCR